MKTSERISRFFTSAQFGVVGASNRRHKFGNKILLCYLLNNLNAIPVNPTELQIEGIDCVATVGDLPDGVKSISIITPPQVTEKVVVQAVEKGIRNIWMQPGAEHDGAMERARKAGMNVIGYGPCLLVALASGAY